MYCLCLAHPPLWQILREAGMFLSNTWSLSSPDRLGMVTFVMSKWWNGEETAFSSCSLENRLFQLLLIFKDAYIGMYAISEEEPVLSLKLFTCFQYWQPGLSVERKSVIGSYTLKNWHTEHLCLITGEEYRNPSELLKYFNHAQKEMGSTEWGKMPACWKGVTLSYVQGINHWP